MVDKLGSGIARVSTVDLPEIRVGRTYSVEGDSLRLLGAIGFAIKHREEAEICGQINPGEMALLADDVWRRTESGEAEIIFSNDDLIKIRSLINRTKGQSGLRDLVRENGQVLAIVRSVRKKDGTRHQVWKPRREEDFQVLADGLFCLHFDQPALGEDGRPLNKREIAAITAKAGYKIRMRADGEISNLPKLFLERLSF